MAVDNLDPVNPLEGETSDAFQAFLVYRNLPGKRSVRNAYRTTEGHQDAKHAPGHWNDWFREYHWKDRALKWDQTRSQTQSKAILEGDIEVGTDFAKHLTQSRLADLKAAQRIRRLCDARLTQLEGNGGRTKISSFELESLSRLIYQTSSIERRAIGMGEEKPAISPEDEEQIKKLAKLPRAELIERRAAAERKMAALGLGVIQGKAEGK